MESVKTNVMVNSGIAKLKGIFNLILSSMGFAFMTIRYILILQ